MGGRRFSRNHPQRIRFRAFTRYDRNLADWRRNRRLLQLHLSHHHRVDGNDTFRSNQIRQGAIDRDNALALYVT